MVFIHIFRYIIKTIEIMTDRLKGNLTIWSILLTVFFLPLIVLGVIFNIKESGWFWGTVKVLVVGYVLYFLTSTHTY
jgi:hypothetical protein